MSYSMMTTITDSIIRNHTTLITDAVDHDTGQLGYAWKDERYLDSDTESTFLFMPYDHWRDGEDEGSDEMAFVERKLESEIGRLNETLQRQARKISLQCLSE
jgi:hypothetical protein